MPALLDLWAASWAEVYADFQADRAWFAAHLNAECASGAVCRLAQDEQGLAGILLIHPASGYIEHICVAAGRKGAGLGRALMAEARRISPAGLDLSVGAANRRAIAFYEREGFRRAGEGVSPRSGLPIYRYHSPP
jgi:putative acetyltransferase